MAEEHRQGEVAAIPRAPSKSEFGPELATREKKSYREVLKIGGWLRRASLSLSRKVISTNLGWLAESLVGTFRWEGAISKIKGFCDACGNEVKIARMGGSEVLLSFDCLKTVWKALEDYKFGFSEIFSSIKQWRPGDFQAVRIVWVRCFVLYLFMDGKQGFSNWWGRGWERWWGWPRRLWIRLCFEYGKACIKVSSHSAIS